MVTLGIAAVGLFGEVVAALSGVWAVVLLVVVALHPAIVAGWSAKNWVQVGGLVRDAFVLMGACLLTSKGLAQVLAFVLADRARQVVVTHRRELPRSLNRALEEEP